MDTNAHIDLGSPIIGQTPFGRAVTIFTPAQDFQEKELSSVYVKGRSYTVREGDEKLASYVVQWVIKGLVIVEEQ